MTSEPIRILLVNDQVVLRTGLRMLIESWPELKVVGEAGTIADAVKISKREKTDIVLLDLGLGAGGSALDYIPELKSAISEASIIALIGTKDNEARLGAVRLGA